MNDRFTTFDLPTQHPFEPAGIAGVIDYNGLTLNDRRSPDRIVIKSISGLDDPEVRDSREQNADRDGETAFNTYYGGRGITLRGYIQAGNWFGLKSLWSDLKLAFDDPVDNWMSFRFNDWREDWEGNWAQDHTFTSGASTDFSASGGQLTMLNTTLKLLLLNKRRYNDGEITLKYTNGVTRGATAVGLIIRYVNASNYLSIYNDAGTLYLQQTVAGVTTTIGSVAFTSSASNASFWVVARVEGNTFTGEIWSSEPTDMGTPSATVSATTPPDLNFSVTGYSGWYLLPDSTSAVKIGRVLYEARNGGDAMIYCRKSGKIESADEVDSNGRVRKEFLLTLRAASPNFVARKLTKASLPVTNANLTFPGDGSGLVFPADGSGILFGKLLSSSVVNVGRSPVYPIVRFYGPCVNPGVYCANTGTYMAAKATLATSSDYLEFDTENRTVKDSSGNSAYDKLGESSGWIVMGRSTNVIYYGADSFTSGTTKVVIYYRHTSR